MRDPIQPQYLMRVIDRLAADDAILSADSGTIATWAARHFDIRGDRRFMLSGNLATMAPGLPYTIAAQWAHPGRQCIAFVGDGGFAMLMAEMLTAINHELPVKVFVNNNSEYGQILWEQMILGYPEFGVRHTGVADFAAFVRANGGLGLRVEKAGDLEAAVADALRHPGPALVDVLTNPDEPPMPPKVSYQQAKGFASAFLRGQPHKATIATTLFRDKIDELRGVSRSHGDVLTEGLLGVDHLVRNVEHGRFERALSGLTAVAALVTGGEIFFEHDRASFGNRMMWFPVVLSPIVAGAGIGGVFSRRLAKTALPAASAVVIANGVQGTYLHARGIAQRPGGWSMARYNAEMGPPALAPLLVTMVGGMGLLAAILRREGR